jgi:hypothetical protein
VEGAPKLEGGVATELGGGEGGGVGEGAGGLVADTGTDVGVVGSGEEVGDIDVRLF